MVAREDNDGPGAPKSLMVVKDISGPVVSVSLLLGVCWLVGTCAGLGAHAFSYVTATDIARSALMVCPLVVLAAGSGQLLRLVFPSTKVFDYVPNPKGVAAQLTVLRFDIMITVVVLLLAYIFLTAQLFAALSPLILMGGVLAMVDALYELQRASRITVVARMMVALALICVMMTCISYMMTSFKFEAGARKSSDVVCLESGCKDAAVIARLSEATFVRWDNSPDLTALPNSQIFSVTLKRQQRADPIVDLRPYLRRAWQAITE